MNALCPNGHFLNQRDEALFSPGGLQVLESTVVHGLLVKLMELHRSRRFIWAETNERSKDDNEDDYDDPTDRAPWLRIEQHRVNEGQGHVGGGRGTRERKTIGAVN